MKTALTSEGEKYEEEFLVFNRCIVAGAASRNSVDKGHFAVFRDLQINAGSGTVLRSGTGTRTDESTTVFKIGSWQWVNGWFKLAVYP